MIDTHINSARIHTTLRALLRYGSCSSTELHTMNASALSNVPTIRIVPTNVNILAVVGSIISHHVTFFLFDEDPWSRLRIIPSHRRQGK